MTPGIRPKLYGMNRPLLFLILFLGLATGVAFVWWGAGGVDIPSPAHTDPAQTERRSAERTGGEAVTRGAVETDRPERQVIDDSVDGGDKEPPAYRRALSGLRGRLVWATSGEPITNLEVSVGEMWLDAVVPKVEDIAGLSKMRSPLVFRAVTRSDEDGVFLLKGVHSRAMLVLTFGLQTDKAGFRVIDRSPNPGELLDLGDIQVVERGTVTGRILDDSGEPVQGARVRIADIPRVAFQFGAEQVNPEGMGLWVQGSYRVVIQFPWWVRDLDKMLPFGDSYSAADGSFEVRGVMPGSPTMIVSKEDLAPMQRTVAVVSDQQTDLGSLTMTEGEVLSGRFEDGNGDPVSTVLVAAGGGNGVVPVAFINKPRQVNPKGEFEIAGLPRNQLYLVYQRKRGMPWEVSGPHRGDDDVVFELGTMLEGTVDVFADPGGRAYEGPVEFSACISDESTFIGGFETMIPGEGHFFRDKEKKNQWAVRDLPEGIYRVIARADGYGLASGVLDLSSKSKDRTVKIHLVSAPKVRFEVTDQEGEPVQAARVYWNSAPDRDKRKRGDMTSIPIIVGKTNIQGVLESTTIPLGSTRFYARHPAYALASQLEIPSSRVVRFVMGRTGSLEGIVAEDGQPPVGDYSVIAVPTGDLRREFAGILLPTFATLGPDGSFRFANLQPGSWRLRVIPSLSKIATPAQMQSLGRSGDSRSPARDVEVVPDGEEFVRLEMQAGSDAEGPGSIIGTVYVQGQPAKGAWVQTWAGQRRVEVEDDGTFKLTGLKDGDLWIGVERAGANGLLPNRLWEGRVKIVDGSQETLQIDVQVGDVDVEVVDASGEPVAGLALAMTGNPVDLAGHRGQTRMAMMTDSKGRAAFGAVPHGEYTLRSAMQREAVVVLPNVRLSVFRAQVDCRVTAVLPVRAAGTVRFDEGELADPLQREWARKRRPKYLVFDHERRYIWGPVTQKDGVYRFTMRPGPPGDYRLMPRGELRWESSVLRVPVEGADNVVITLRPDAAQVRSVFAKQKASKGSGEGK